MKTHDCLWSFERVHVYLSRGHFLSRRRGGLSGLVFKIKRYASMGEARKKSKLIKSPRTKATIIHLQISRRHARDQFRKLVKKREK